MVKYLTSEGLEKLKKELEHLKTVGRKEVAEQLRHNAAFGDLKENAGYDAARDAQAFLECRIVDLQDILSQAKVIEKKECLEVQIGSTILVSIEGEEEKFQIVGPEEADILKGKISYQSPIGKALLGKKKGSVVKIETPGGKIEYKIIEIE